MRQRYEFEQQLKKVVQDKIQDSYKEGKEVNKQEKKESCAIKGAKIALGVDLTTRFGLVLAGFAIHGKSFISSLKSIIKPVGVRKFGAITAGNILLSTLIGAGIGKIVDVVKEHKAQKAE